jgi:hypothetical protein
VAFSGRAPRGGYFLVVQRFQRLMQEV